MLSLSVQVSTLPGWEFTRAPNQTAGTIFRTFVNLGIELSFGRMDLE